MPKNETIIHSLASVHPEARLDTGVHIGPYSLIGKRVSIGKHTWIDAHVSIQGVTSIGKNCRFSPFSSLGTEPQDVTYKGEETALRIGNDNIFREFIVINRGTLKGGGVTSIGDHNYFMAHSHVAHDCQVGSETIFLHAAILGGHVIVEDYATVGASSGIHQFCRIGRYAYIGGYSVITQDIVPFSLVVGGRPTQFLGVNAVGLRRKGFSRERIKAIKEIFNLIFYSNLNTTQALIRIKDELPLSGDREEIFNFIQSSKRGFVKKTNSKWQNGSE
ncbi:MAG: acyl-ACP--UDP-N-acetylglucosamine O-acyltransferase [Candidatus Aminicenantes bacterium]|nr:acyl-ACP--UDP-N-acetylglucosamine O-acyltransferase [Candidatus Aminicenantes bacterium]